MKLLITGGHVTPALAVIDEILKEKRLQPKDIVFVGRKKTAETDSFEYKEISKRNIRFINLSAGRFSRVFSLASFINLLRVPIGFLHARVILLQQKPTVILSFGGYMALPITFWGWVLHIPVYTHEQTIKPGLANRLIGTMAKKVFLSFPESKKYINNQNSIVTGNPVRPEIFTISAKPFEIKKDKPVIYITGGSTGSHSINVLIEKIIEKLLKEFIVIHQTGDSAPYNDFERLSKLKESFSEEEGSRYFLQKHFSSQEIGSIYSLADLVIGRAGANTFFELVALKKPTIFIPLPWAGFDEQKKQAEIFEKAGTGKIFSQDKSAEELFRLISQMFSQLDTYKNNFTSLSTLYNGNAAQKIIETIFQ
jgi:UDP-N-acetylglucosamine--N-acetylmuramyl-(pentapeptide) pyrophosphoryl-undecaprenol N-acetylglucosamine transferase